MGFLTTNHVCCCFSLRTGGFVLGYIALAASILAIFGSFAVQSPVGVRMNLPCLILSICWLYGLHERKPAWLLLNVILSVLAFLAFIFIFIICTGIMVSFAYCEMYPSADLPLHDFPLYLTLYFFFALIMVFKWHITAAMLSLYKAMRAEEANRASANHSYLVSNLTQQFETIKCKPMMV